MKIGLLAAGGSWDLPFAKEFLKRRRYDYIAGVDGGLLPLRELGMKPDAAVGDFDTVDSRTLAFFHAQPDICFQVFKPEKDESDMELALMAARDAGCTQVDILGATGGRMDHSITNIHLMYRFCRQGMESVMYDAQNQIRFLFPGQSHRFFKRELPGTYISFLPFTETVEGITLEGFSYPLKDKTITVGTSLCISNQLAAEQGSLTFTGGVLLCIVSSDFKTGLIEKR